LLDFAMPGMNGAEVARLMQETRPGLPILFLTGFADSAALSGVGEEDVIRKPFDARELGARLRAAISRGRYAQRGLAPADQ
jgi:DNA-binding response OmpR family regulator